MSIDTTPATAAEPTEPTELSEPTEPTQRPERPAPRAQVWPLAPLQEGLLYHAVSGERQASSSHEAGASGYAGEGPGALRPEGG